MTNFVVFILDMFNSLLSTLVKPIDLLLSSIIPNYDSLASNVSTLFNYFYNTFLFVINWLHIPSEAITILVGYITFRVTLFFGTLGYKFAVKWYNVLKN